MTGFYLLSLEDAIANHRAFSTDPRSSEGWLPVFANGGGDFYVVDMSSPPGAPGRPGRVEALGTVSARDEIQQLVDEFATSHGYSKRSGSWYRRQGETIAVLDLQRSDYAHAYYMNVALWLLTLGDATTPKEHTCHVRTRAARLVDDEQALELALDMTKSVDDRASVIVDALTVADELLASCSTIAGCRIDPGATLVDRSLVRGPAQLLLSGS